MAVRVGVCGSSGRMGKTIVELCCEIPAIELTAAIAHAKSSALGKDIGEVAKIGRLGVDITSDIVGAADKMDVLIDFSDASSAVEHVQKCVLFHRKLVIGTTGLSADAHQYIQAASKKIAIVMSPNMSIGVNLCLKLMRIAAQTIGHSADIEIIEAHHRNKKDAPSGTAIRMGEVIADSIGRDLSQCAIYGREGVTGTRDDKTIGFETIRAGDIVGEHTVMFATQGERVEISHKASSRKTFAYGAIRAAQWLMNQDKGLFDMQDVLALA